MQKINTEELNNLLQESNKLAVKFSAKWCQPCKTLDKNLEGLNYYTIDIDEEGILLPLYSIKSVPTILFFEDGEEKDRTVGVITREKFLEVYDNTGRKKSMDSQ